MNKWSWFNGTILYDIRKTSSLHGAAINCIREIRLLFSGYTVHNVVVRMLQYTISTSISAGNDTARIA